MNAFKKVIRPGTTQSYGGKWISVYCKIKWDETSLTISGVEGPTSGGNAIGSSGQISRVNIGHYAPGWNFGMASKFFDLWRRWHLNDMRSGCEHQRAMGWTYREHRGNDSLDMFEGDKCPVCGYRIGSAWLTEKVPEDVLKFFVGLPDIDINPAWV